jgi:hypothetical protein
MTYPRAYEPVHGQKYQILCKAPNEGEYEHLDYAVDKAEKDFLLKEYDMAYYRFRYTFKVITLPKKYWKE